MTLLVTGGAGFIGSNYIEHLLGSDTDVEIVNLDKLTYAGNLDNLIAVKDNPRYHFVHGDINDLDLVMDVFNAHKIHGVVHFAAESHVDNSIETPDTFIETNILGTFNLLKVCYSTWMSGPQQLKPGCESFRFLHVSTDEVYGSLGKTGKFSETTCYAPNSPYSASKAASDFLVRSYYHTYGLNVVTTNCSNNFGPHQHDEKLIPTIIRKALQKEDIPIYGDGQNIRDWLYVEDHCRGIEAVRLSGRSGETYNIGSDTEKTNLDIAYSITKALDDMAPRDDGRSYRSQIAFVKDRPGHDLRYAIDATKIRSELGWSPKESFELSLRKTVSWYLKKYTAL